MKDTKTGFLFPEAEKPQKGTKTRRSRKKSAMEEAREKILAVRDRQTRLKIIQGIANSKESWVCEVLVQTLEDPSEDIRNFIIETLSNREIFDLNLLYQRLHKPPWYVKTGCLRILGKRKKASSVKHIESLMNDPNIEVRRTLALVLGEIGGDRALALLTKLSKDDSTFVRAPALQALQEVSHAKLS